MQLELYEVLPMKQKSKFVDLLFTYLIIAVAALIYAIGFNWCYKPNSIAFGGLTGVGQLVNALLPWAPIGTVVIILNIPLFFVGWRLLGGHLLVSSLFAMAASSLCIDLVNLAYVFPPMDPMLASIFGGVLMGLALGLVFSRGATTGGTDLIARLLKLKIAWLPMGKLMMMIDLLVIVSVAAAFRDLASAMYGLVSLYIASIVMDGVLYGLDNAKVAYIISDRYRDITDKIVQDLDRGVTLLHGEGGYSGQGKNVLLCAFKQRQIVEIKRLVKEIDPAAFIIVCEAHEVLGDGFRDYHQNDL
ncbi:MAG: YitT family protein [Pseudoflavonifractor sp.]